MRTDYRWLVIFGGNLVFLFLVGQLNHYLTDVSLFGITHGQAYLFLPGLPLAFVALRLNLLPAVGTTVATALAIEAVLPLRSGTLLLPAAACVCMTIAFRAHFNRFEPSTAVFAALIINLVMIVAVTLVTFPSGGVSVGRVLVDLFLSQVALGLFTGWYFAAQTALLRLFGFDLDTELRETV